MHRAFLIPFLLIAAGSAGLFGSGTRVDYVDAFAVGRGNAFSATADNPSAVYYNPAGITRLEGLQARAGAYLISLDYSLRQGGNDIPMDDGYQALPSLFATWALPNADRASVGLGLYAPFGLATDWPDDAPFFAVADRSELVYLTLHPVVAWKVSDTLSIGGGPTLNQAELEFDQQLTGFFFSGDDTSVGWVASALWEPDARHAFAVVFRSKADSDFSGELRLPVGGGGGLPSPAEASFVFPDSWRFGYSFKPTPAWNFEVNAEWMNWDRLNTVILQNEIAPVPFVFNWESSWFYEFGGTRFFDNGWHLSAGWVWVENSIPDATYTPIVPDSDRSFLSLGVGFRGERWAVDGVIQHGRGDRTLPATGGGPGREFGGAYQTDTLAFNISFSYRF